MSRRLTLREGAVGAVSGAATAGHSTTRASPSAVASALRRRRGEAEPCGCTPAGEAGRAVRIAVGRCACQNSAHNHERAASAQALCVAVIHIHIHIHIPHSHSQGGVSSSSCPNLPLVCRCRAAQVSATASPAPRSRRRSPTVLLKDSGRARRDNGSVTALLARTSRMKRDVAGACSVLGRCATSAVVVSVRLYGGGARSCGVVAVPPSSVVTRLPLRRGGGGEGASPSGVDSRDHRYD